MNTESRIEKLEKEIEAIKSRNKRVEADKAWETSMLRIIAICCMTYVVSVLVFGIIKIPNPLQNALIPTVAFFISMQSLPFIKKYWTQKYWKK